MIYECVALCIPINSERIADNDNPTKSKKLGDLKNVRTKFQRFKFQPPPPAEKLPKRRSSLFIGFLVQQRNTSSAQCSSLEVIDKSDTIALLLYWYVVNQQPASGGVRSFESDILPTAAAAAVDSSALATEVVS